MKYFVLLEPNGPWVEVTFRRLIEIAKSCYAVKVCYTDDIFEVYYSDKK